MRFLGTVLALWLASTAALAQSVGIDRLNPAQTLTGDERVPIQQGTLNGGATVRTTIGAIVAAVQQGISCVDTFYPFVLTTGCIKQDKLNAALNLSPAATPPVNGQGQGAGFGKPWLDTSADPTFVLRMCVKSTGCSLTYISTEWASLYSFNGGSVTIAPPPPPGDRAILTGTVDTLSHTDDIVYWASDAIGGKTENLPVCNSSYKRETHYVVDRAGDALAQPITLIPPGGSTVNGQASLVISQNRGAVGFTCDGVSNWAVLSNTQNSSQALVSSNTTLAAAATTTFPSGVWRLGANTLGDAPPLFYLPSASPCTLLSWSGTGSISNGLLTVATTTTGHLRPGLVVTGGSTPGGTIVTNQSTLTGGEVAGGAGRYAVNNSQTVGSATLTAYGDGGSQIPTTDGGCLNAVFEAQPDARQWGLKPVAGVSNDLAFDAAAKWCTSTSGHLILPSGVIDFTGTVSLKLDHCTIAGISGMNSLNDNAPGTEIRLLSTTTTPFMCGNNWAISDISFIWPNNTTGTIAVYPPLFGDDGVNDCDMVNVHRINIVNAYDGFKQTLGRNWTNWKVEDNRFFAAHHLFEMALATDSWKLMNNQKHHSVCGQRRDFDCTAFMLAAGQQSVMLYVNGNAATVARGGIGGLQWYGNSTYLWAYGIYVADHGYIENSWFETLWDGVGTTLKVDNGCLNNVTFVGQSNNLIVGAGNVPLGHQPVFDVVAGAVGAVCPAISDLKIWNFEIDQMQGDAIDISGANLYVNNMKFGGWGLVNDGADYYAIHSTGSTPTEISVRNSWLVPAVNNIHHRGILATNPTTRVMIQNNEFLAVCKAWDFGTAASGPIITTGNLIDATPGDCQGSDQLLTFGTASNVVYHDNIVDFPPVASVTPEHATFNGHILGTALTMDNTLVGTIAKGEIITGPGVASNTFVVSGSGSNWVVSVSQPTPVGSGGSPVALVGDGCGGAGATVLGAQSVHAGAIQVGSVAGTTACKLTLNVPVPGFSEAYCLAAPGFGTSIIPVYLSLYDVIFYSATGSSLTDTQIIWNCMGSR